MNLSQINLIALAMSADYMAGEIFSNPAYESPIRRKGYHTPSQKTVATIKRREKRKCAKKSRRRNRK
jgi:hypothetical protein